VKPLAIDLFSGLHGWARGLVLEGWEVVAFDIEDMCAKFGESRPEGIHAVVQDVLTLHGSQFRDAGLIVASPPCQAYSYRAMPWSRAKALPPPSNELFDACFRIQREACEASGRHIPLIVENVRGAQKWVGRSRWNYGSFHLWGDVPALMPFSRQPSVAAAVKLAGKSLNPGVGKWRGEDQFGYGDNAGKQGGDWFNAEQPSISRLFSSRSAGRKAASAQIAKIPFPLAQHIARVYHP